MSDPRPPDPRMIPAWQAPRQVRRRDLGGAEKRVVNLSHEENLVRPFLVTQGRTKPAAVSLRLETLVITTPGDLAGELKYEPRTVVQVCAGSPRSVAEIAVYLRVPIGVARVLIADLILAGHLQYQQAHEVPIAILERIRDRVRAL
jgi:hypothetical protein